MTLVIDEVVSGGTLALDDILVGGLAISNLTLRNTGVADVTISSVVISNSDFGYSLYSDFQILSPDEVGTFSVYKLSTAVAGDFSTLVTINSNAAGSPYTFTLALTVSEPENATSPYFTLTEFLNRWGRKNIAIASNKDNTTTAINYAALQDSFDYAASEIDRAFAGGIYLVPLDFSQNNGVPGTVKRWAMILAYSDLYDARGQDDRDKVWNKISVQLKAVYADMAMHAAGLRQLPAKTSNAEGTPGPMQSVTFEPLTQTLCREPGSQPIYRCP